MRNIKNCPHCSEKKPLCKKYFGEPLMGMSKLSQDKEFMVQFEIDVCMNCNTVYATSWSTTRMTDVSSKDIKPQDAGLIKIKKTALASISQTT